MLMRRGSSPFFLFLFTPLLSRVFIEAIDERVGNVHLPARWGFLKSLPHSLLLTIFLTDCFYIAVFYPFFLFNVIFIPPSLLCLVVRGGDFSFPSRSHRVFVNRGLEHLFQCCLFSPPAPLFHTHTQQYHSYVFMLVFCQQ